MNIWNRKQFSYGKQIYDLSDEPELNENQQKYLELLKRAYKSSEMCMTVSF